MVDDRALRFRRRTPAGEPPGQTRTQREDRVPVSPYEGQPTMDQAYNRTVESTFGPATRGFVDRFADFFLPNVAPAVREGRLGVGDVAKEAAGYAAGGLIGRGVGKGLEAAAPMFDDAARRVAPWLAEFLKRPVTGYRGTLGKNVLDDFFRETDEIIPRGTELYRLPSAGQVAPYRYSQSVPMPREIGAEFLPGRVQSVAGSADLNRLGAIMRGLVADTGGNAQYSPGMVSITTMDDIPGIADLPGFLARYADDIPANLPTESEFVSEGLLGPATRYILREFVEGQGDAPPTWFFNAYRN